MEILTCNVALVNWESLKSFKSIILPTGEILDFDFTMQDLINSHTGISFVFIMAVIAS